MANGGRRAGAGRKPGIGWKPAPVDESPKHIITFERDSNRVMMVITCGDPAAALDVLRNLRDEAKTGFLDLHGMVLASDGNH